MSLRVRKRRKTLSMTSLIDVIFLLLLFFMLSSTFSRFAEVEIAVGGGKGAVQPSEQRILFLRIGKAGLNLNGAPVPISSLRAALASEPDEAVLLVSISKKTSAQQLADVLVATRDLPKITVNVLEGS